MAQDCLEGATPRPRSGAEAERRYPANKVRGGCREELTHAPTPETRGRGPEDQPHVQGVVGARVLEGLRSFSMFEVRRGGSEEIPLVQGKEQWLCFAGAAVKR